MRLSSISQTTFSSPSFCADVLLSETNLSKQNVSRRPGTNKTDKQWFFILSPVRNPRDHDWHGSWKFMKALKPPLSKLRFDKIAIAAYLDDCLIMDKMKGKCSENTKTIINTFQNSRFTVNPEPKSSFYPTQQIEFLGFEINSVSMTITLTNAKTENLKLFCAKIFRENYRHFTSCKICQIALQRRRKV